MASDKDTSGQLNFVTSPFDAIRHMDGEREFWQARELSKILGYNRWENFENVIAKAKIACKYNGRDMDDHFREVTKLIKAAKGAKTHFEIGHKVRKFIIHELGGTPPEELPTPEKSIRQLEQEEQFRLKHKV